MSHDRPDARQPRQLREDVDGHRDEINADVQAALGQLDGSTASAVSLMTGLSPGELDDLGGLPS